MSVAYRRGFKTEVKSLVAELRADFGVRPLDPIDPTEVASWLGIPVVGISAAGPDLTGQFRLSTASGKFHAATLPFKSGHLIVHNDLSSQLRQKSDIAHELGHVFLEHKFMPVNGNLEDRDSAVEREADWFGFALLVTDEAALSLARANLPVAECARMLNVSEEAMKFRLHASGAIGRAKNERSRRRR